MKKNSLVAFPVLLGLLLSLMIGCSPRHSENEKMLRKAPHESETEEQAEDLDIHSYAFVINNCSWDQAYALAKEQGGYLANFNSIEEYEEVITQLEAQGYHDVYFRIGGMRDENSKNYFWINDTKAYGASLNDPDAWCLDLWLAGEPTFEWDGLSEQYLEMYYNNDEARWVWCDVKNEMTYPTDPEKCGFIIEFPETIPNELLDETHENDYDVSNLVTDAYSYSYTYEGDEPQYHTGEVGLEYHIPQINIDSDEVDAINKEIWERLYDTGMCDVLESISLGTSVIVSSISYQWAVNDDILSLYTEIRYPGDCNYHLVYNVSISTGRTVSDQELIAYAGFSEEEYLETAKQSVGSHYLSYYGYDSANPSEFIKYNRMVLARTLQDDSLSQARPFLNDQGELCVYINMYASAGAESYEQMCNLENFELLPYQDVLDDPHSGYDPVLAEFYSDYDVSVCHAFYDMNRDGTDELIVHLDQKAGEVGREYHIYTLTDGTSELVGITSAWHAFLYVPNDGNDGLYIFSTSAWAFSLEQITIQNNELVRDMIHTETGDMGFMDYTPPGTEIVWENFFPYYVFD